ncbi:helix-turn-helix domain-containing protein [Terracidiphilus sp.]|jgi:excisionase family DNA binding protein|uniref:helix-turn-helix domain-containing protein n=1 Tax=Terracidiphilus sp. TaxID=1964191 RepID=UPI003C72E862
MNRLLTVDEVARMTGWRPATIRQKVWRRELPYLKLGRSVRFKEAEILKIIDASSIPALERQ